MRQLNDTTIDKLLIFFSAKYEHIIAENLASRIFISVILDHTLMFFRFSRSA